MTSNLTIRAARLLAVVSAIALAASACASSGSTDANTDDPLLDTASTTAYIESSFDSKTESSAAIAEDSQVVGDPQGENGDTSATDLIGCASSIADDVPAFYATYFRCTDISVEGEMVVISSDGLPRHESFYWDEDSESWVALDTSRGTEYFQNPNTISDASFTLRVPINPVESGIVVDEMTVNLSVGDDTDYPFGTAGVALDGVSLFNSLARPGDDITDEKWSFDAHEGHPQNTGTYHYHAAAVGPLAVLQSLGFTTIDIPGAAEIELYGVMCDGTVVMGTNELDATTPIGELDVQAGHVHDISNADGTVLLENRYHIHMDPGISLDPRGLTPEAQYYTTCDL